MRILEPGGTQRLTMGYGAKSIAVPARFAARDYALSVLSVGIATGLSYAFLYFNLPLPFTSLALCAIAIAFWYGSIRVGILAAFLSAVVRFFCFERELPAISRLIYDLVFVAFAILMTEATRARNELEVRVAERTSALTEAIEQLRLEIGEHKRTEEKLRRSEAYLAEAQRLSHTGSWAFNPALDKMVHWSAETFRIIGFDPREGPPDLQTYRERIHPEDRDRVHQIRAWIFHEKVDYADDYRVLLPDGHVKHVHVIGHPVFDDSGEVVEYVGTVVDVTDRKRAEEEHERLRLLEADLARIDRVTTMGELTASLAHELRQPIAAAIMDAVTCVTWLTREHPDTGEAREAASRAVTAATRASEIITRIRTMFMKSGPERQLVAVNEVIREMLRLLRNELTRHSISIEATLADDIPQVMGDRVQLQQVMMNLIVNSIDAMKGVDRVRTLSIKSERGDNHEVLVSVSDTGVGLPDERQNIFEPFFTTKVHGTGMGLRISRSIIESHGGRLWAAGNFPRGASFHLSLPSQVQADGQ